MTHFERLDTEHRAAWNEIVLIEKSKESTGAKIQRIIKLFDTELLPHFKDEEDNVLTNDSVSMELLDEHQRIYKLIASMKAGTAGEGEIREFSSILKSHIKKEDKYFAELQRVKRQSGNILAIAFAVIIGLSLIAAFYFKSGKSVLPSA